MNEDIQKQEFYNIEFRNAMKEVLLYVLQNAKKNDGNLRFPVSFLKREYYSRMEIIQVCNKHINDFLIRRKDILYIIDQDSNISKNNYKTIASQNDIYPIDIITLFITKYIHKYQYETFNESNFDTFYYYAERELYSDTIKYQQNYWIYDLDCENGITIRDVYISDIPLTARMNINNLPIYTSLGNKFISIIQEIPKGVIQNIHIDKANNIFSEFRDLLNIYKDGKINVLLVTYEYPYWIDLINATGSTLYPNSIINKGEYFIEEDDIPKIENLHNLYDKYDNKVFLKSLQNRFDLALYRSSNEDKIVDYMIILEFIFINGFEKKSFLLALRTAIFLTQDNAERKIIYYEMRKAYKLRNSIVHSGGSIDDNVQLEDTNKIISQYVRAIICKIIEVNISKEDLIKQLENIINKENLYKEFKAIKY